MNDQLDRQFHIEAQHGWAAYNQGEYSQAEAAFRRAVQLNTADLDSLFGLGMVLRYSDKTREAIQVFTEVITNAELIEENPKARMVRNLAVGHIHQIESGDWNLEKEIWQRK